MSSDAMLDARNLVKSFGGLRAVDGASFSLEPGELVGLIGPNGAGKTTTFNLLAGALQPTGGQVRFDGRDVTGLPADKRARQGLVRTFQIPRPFRRLSVFENTLVAGTDHPGEGLLDGVLNTGRAQRREEDLRAKAREVLGFVGLADKSETLAGHLSGGQRKLLEIARGLMLDPKVLLLDEPMAGVNPTLQEEIVDRLKVLHDRGLTLLIVEHDMEFVVAHCPRAIVMVQGEILVDGPPEEVLEDPRVLEAYLGGGRLQDDEAEDEASAREGPTDTDPDGGDR